MKKFLLSLIVGLSFLCFIMPVYAKRNLLNNPSFEDGLNEWKTTSWNTQSDTFKFKVEKGDGHSGDKFVSVENIQENDSRFVQAVRVKRGKKYRLAAWIKTENVGDMAKGACLSAAGRLETSNDIKGTSGQWKLSEMYIRVGAGIDTIEVALCLGGYNSINSGKAYFDDASFTEVAKIPKGAVTAEINNQETASAHTLIKQANRGQVVWKLFLVGLLLTLAAFYFIHREAILSKTIPLKDGNADRIHKKGVK